MKIVELYALPEHHGRRIDVFVSEQLPQLTRSAVQRLCGEARVTVEGRPCDKNLRLRGGEAVAVNIPPARQLELRAQCIPLDIVYEDADLIVINKQQGLVVHPGPGNEDGTLVNALLAHCGGELPHLTRNGIQRLCAQGRVTVDGAPREKNYRLRGQIPLPATIHTTLFYHRL